LALAYAQNGVLTTEQQNQLLAVAIECPHTDGLGIYPARILYNQILADAGATYYPFFANCDPSGIYKKPQALASSTEVAVYPNPAHSNVTVSVTGINTGSVDLTLTSIDGKIIAGRKQFILVNRQVIYPLDVSAGLYLLQITTANNEIVTKKIFVD
jgi:Secretion system C-terminal sorting domain